MTFLCISNFTSSTGNTSHCKNTEAHLAAEPISNKELAERMEDGRSPAGTWEGEAGDGEGRRIGSDWGIFV